jgi:hypothetical protein
MSKKDVPPPFHIMAVTDLDATEVSKKIESSQVRLQFDIDLSLGKIDGCILLALLAGRCR